MPQVSIIVLTYNPDNVKLRQTLTAAAAQQEIDLELIISDDGSNKKDFSFLPDFMAKLGIKNYKLLDHQNNRGTVSNCYEAIKASVGEYVFLTSPGDFLFDEYVLRDLYRFAKENNAPLCFGNAVFYATTDNGPVITRVLKTPPQPQLYKPGASLSQIKTSFLGGNWVIGASYFRSRALALDCFEKITKTSTYMEDTPTTAFALAAGNRLCYYDRNVVWYEDGTGVSTGTSEKWSRLLKKDLDLSFKKLKQQFPKDPYVDIAFRNATEQCRIKRIAGNLLRHPVIMVRLATCRKAEPAAIFCTQEDLALLTHLLETK